MFNKIVFKSIACVVAVCYFMLINASGILAAELQTKVNPLLFAQTAAPGKAAQERSLNIGGPGGQEMPPVESLAPEDQQALQGVYAEKMQRLESEMNAAKGVRKNLLNIAIAAFAIGATLTFGVNTVNSAIDDIPMTNPESQPTTACVEDRYDACNQYIAYNQEKQDAQNALDGIKGIGAGIFIAGAASVIGYFLYTRNIRSKQQDIDVIRAESGKTVAPQGLTPEYLQKNESVAAVVAEMDVLKKQASAKRTMAELFSRLALGGVGSGLFLFGLSNVSHTLVGDIAIDERVPENVTAKNKALTKTKDMEKIGAVLLGAGVAAGVTSFLFGRLATGKERELNNLENSLLRIVDRLEFEPKADGFRLVYRSAF